MIRAGQIHVLLIEDNPADARLARELFRDVEEAGVRISHAATLDDALQCAGNERFDVVLLDLSLADAQGLTALDRIQEKIPQTPIVVLSGLGDQDVAIAAMQRGAQDYIVKDNCTGDLVFRAIRYAIERKRVQVQILAEKERAEVANRTMTEFLANMSHELRTPLNAIIGFSEILKDELYGAHTAPHYKEYAGSIYGSGQHLLEIINDILDISRIELGKQTVNEKVVPVPELIGTCVRLIDMRAKKGDVNVVLELSPELGAVRADPRMLKQIILNLLANAVKFTPAPGTVRVLTGIAAGGGAWLSVSDTGIGIAEENIPKVVLPFFQVESSMARKFEGTGLGLALVKSMVELHGGTLELVSKVQAGTTVTVRLPRERIIRDVPQPARQASR
jgi:signal transduction histidine kinase